MTRISGQAQPTTFFEEKPVSKKEENHQNIKGLLNQIESGKFDPLNLDMQVVKAKDKPKANPGEQKKPGCSTRTYLPTRFQGPPAGPKK